MSAVNGIIVGRRRVTRTERECEWRILAEPNVVEGALPLPMLSHVCVKCRTKPRLILFSSPIKYPLLPSHSSSLPLFSLSHPCLSQRPTKLQLSIPLVVPSRSYSVPLTVLPPLCQRVSSSPSRVQLPEAGQVLVKTLACGICHRLALFTSRQSTAKCCSPVISSSDLATYLFRGCPDMR